MTSPDEARALSLSLAEASRQITHLALAAAGNEYNRDRVDRQTVHELYRSSGIQAAIILLNALKVKPVDLGEHLNGKELLRRLQVNAEQTWRPTE